MATASLYFNKIGISYMSTISQIVILILTYKVLFYKSMLSSALITATSYLIFGAIQGLFIVVLMLNNLVKTADLQPFTSDGYAIQFFSSMIIIIIVFIIKRLNEGFSFDPHERKGVNFKYDNKMLWFLITLFLVSVISFYSEYKAFMNLEAFAILLSIVVIFSISLLVINIKREQEDSK
ncbi:hypothetical protein NV379_02185 [Paenibacillus sp. N1-5-1-14]|uniref:hypothetical protein n=1 Tax=Paenibacillus radicibacter TaxID=2972488 RepID=UPI0021593017|nr:hypothetical protein [Paenibacillus radicibacter]MCR8641455.1 hypothetical protein [Paenibacillus radicibacter]